MTEEALKVFISYAREDLALRDELVQSLKKKILEKRTANQRWSVVFYDRQISSGLEWEKEIDQHINQAHIICSVVNRLFFMVFLSVWLAERLVSHILDGSLSR